MSLVNKELDACGLRLAFKNAVDNYPTNVHMPPAFVQWWTQFYVAIRDSQEGLALLAELQELKDYKAKHENQQVDNK